VRLVVIVRGFLLPAARDEREREDDPLQGDTPAMNRAAAAAFASAS
jgi:hypothetical protein